MKSIKLPTAQTILIIISFFVALLTWVVPSGKYSTLAYNKDSHSFVISTDNTTTNIDATQASLNSLGIRIPIVKFTSGDIYKPINIPNTYNNVEAKPQGFMEFIQAPIKGIIETADIIFLVLIIGGLIEIMNLSGAFESGITSLSNALRGREFLLIIITLILFALGGTTFGMAEETLAFYPILIPVFLAAGYDALVGVACIFLGSAIGSMCSTTNPFSVVIASDAAGISWTTGLQGRLVLLVTLSVICIIYIIRYAQRVKKHPSKSIIYNQREELNILFKVNPSDTSAKLTLKHKVILIIFTLSFVVMVYGVAKLGWWFVEMSTIFFVSSVLIGLIARIKEIEFVDAFCRGAASLLGVAFIIGIARGISILMTDGMISDTILYNASMLTEGMNKGLFINVLFIIYNGLSFFIPSSSGMAVLTMPIISPLADSVGIGREVIVNAYQYGMGVFYIINPASLILATLAITKIGFDKWLKFVFPLLIMITIVTMVALSISVYF